MAKFYAVLINQAGGTVVPNDRIEACLSGAVRDWMRFNAGQYIVTSDLSAEAIYRSISSVLPPPSRILVSAVDIRDRHGWADDIVVEWVKRYAP